MQRRKHLRARRNCRGSILVEAIVVIPTFILLFGGMLFLHHVIREQQRVMKEVRNQVWTTAMAGCRGGGNGVPQPNFTSTMPGAPGAEVSVQQNLGIASGSGTSFVAVSSLGSGAPPVAESNGPFAFSSVVSSHATVYCNNETESGNIRGVFSWLIGAAQQLMGIL